MERRCPEDNYEKHPATSVDKTGLKSSSMPSITLNSNPKEQRRFQEYVIISFFEQGSDTRDVLIRISNFWELALVKFG